MKIKYSCQHLNPQHVIRLYPECIMVFSSPNLRTHCMLKRSGGRREILIFQRRAGEEYVIHNGVQLVRLHGENSVGRISQGFFLCPCKNYIREVVLHVGDYVG